MGVSHYRLKTAMAVMIKKTKLIDPTTDLAEFISPPSGSRAGAERYKTRKAIPRITETIEIAIMVFASRLDGQYRQ